MKRLFLLCGLIFASSYASGQFRCDLSTEAKPWFGDPTTVQTPDYRFVLLADRTGGPDTKAFQRAIDEVNRLAPDFVICIGDLIDGYVSDTAYSVPQWDEIYGIIGRLEAPLFLVGGNHDLSNPSMTADWKRRFGTTYYHFTMGDDLFLVLDTEEHDGRAISKEQTAYFEKVLKGWNGRWIYIFMHSPVWRDSHGGYEEIEPLLAGHNYTLFSGHTHRYYMEVRGGMEHYTVATTGGDSGLLGAKLGEMDHYLYVTARTGKPAIANLPLGAMLPNDVVNPTTEPLVNTLFSGRNVRIAPVLTDNEQPESILCTVEVQNPQKQTLICSASIPEIEGVTCTPQQLDLEVAAGERATGTFTLSTRGADPSLLTKIPVNTRCGYEIDGETVFVEQQHALLTDALRTLTEGSVWSTECNNPAYIKEDWDWHGVDDGRFSLKVERTKKELIITVTAHDEYYVHSDDVQAPQDRIAFYLSDDTEHGFLAYSAWELRPGTPVRTLEKGAFKGKISGVCTADEKAGTMTATLRVPLGSLQGDRIRLNVSFTDCDNPRNTKPSVLWWKPMWGWRDTFRKSGQFKIR